MIKTYFKVIFFLASVIFFGMGCESSIPAASSRSIKMNQQWAEKMFAVDVTMPLPFSFVYGGRKSSDLVGRYIAVQKLCRPAGKPDS